MQILYRDALHSFYYFQLSTSGFKSIIYLIFIEILYFEYFCFIIQERGIFIAEILHYMYHQPLRLRFGQFLYVSIIQYIVVLFHSQVSNKLFRIKLFFILRVYIWFGNKGSLGLIL